MHDREAGQRGVWSTPSADRQDERVVMVQVPGHPGGRPGPGKTNFNEPSGHLGDDLYVGG
jgi:hypothetical protein